MIKFQCSQCSKEMSVADEHAGKKARCPQCKEIVSIPQTGQAIKPAQTPPRSAPATAAREAIVPRPAPKAPAAVKRRPPEDDEDIPEVEAADEPEELEEVEDRPRRKKRRIRKGDWADCPNCDCPGDATRVRWTLWGGIIGPMLICHVRCNRCGTAYNGKSGKSNTTAIILYIVIPLVIVAALGVLGVILEGK